MILTLSFLMFIPISVSIIRSFNTLDTKDADIRNIPIYCYFFLYPFLALLGDRFIRYRIELAGTFLIAFGTVIIFVWSFLHYHSNNSDITLLYYASFLPYYFGLALFQSNIIQLDTDQLLFASLLAKAFICHNSLIHSF